MNKTLEKLLDKARELGWVVTHDNDDTYNFAKYSSCGQDFSFDIDTEDDPHAFLDNLYNRWDAFDVSYETYLWLDEDGHGKNGAPYDMKDVYEDMQECENNIKDLFDDLSDYLNEIEEDEQ